MCSGIEIRPLSLHSVFRIGLMRDLRSESVPPNRLLPESQISARGRRQLQKVIDAKIRDERWQESEEQSVGH